MRALLLFALVSLVGFGSSVAKDENAESWQVPVLVGKDGWMTYQNPRFGFSLPVPPGMKTLRPPDNGDGQRFVSADGKVSVTGWAHFNNDPAISGVEASWRAELAAPDRTITYKKKAEGWYVVSGAGKDGTGFYTKYTASAKYFAGFTITYPQADEKKYESLIERIAKDWQPRLGKGEDTLGDAEPGKEKRKPK